MTGYTVFVRNGELRIAHGMDAAQQLAQRLTDAIASGEAVGVVVRSVDGAALLR